jgi:hypothetical protein
MGLSYKSLGLNCLPHNKEASWRQEVFVDYSMPKEESSINHWLSDNLDNFDISFLFIFFIWKSDK